MKNLPCASASFKLSATWYRPMRPLVVLAVLLVSSACDNGTRMSSPTSPSTTSPSSPGVTYTLSGTVTEVTGSSSAAVQGAVVRDDNSGRQTTTDGSGFYSLAGLPTTSRAVSASKPGYTTTRSSVVLNGDTRLDLAMTREVTYVLSGVVFEITSAGRVPIEGASVYCDSCGDVFGHTYTYTDATGLFRLAWTRNGATPLIVGKKGYALAGNPPAGPVEGWIVVSVNGDTDFDIELVRR